MVERRTNKTGHEKKSRGRWIQSVAEGRSENKMKTKIRHRK